MSPQEYIFHFKKVEPDDIQLIYQWLQEPHVKQWWPVPEKNEFFDQFLEKIRSKKTFPYLVYLNNIPIGYIQYYYIDRSLDKAGKWLPELPETIVGTDQFIGDQNYIGKGYGTTFIKEFINYLKKIEPWITTIIVDPEPENTAAIRCYEKIGFKKVGEFTTPYGQALLMRYDIKETTND